MIIKDNKKINPIIKDNKKINPIIKDKDAKSIKVNLSLDGKDFGEVSYSAYSAVRGNYLDRYSPIDSEEKKVLDEYKEFVDNLTVDFKLSDGTNLGKISKKGLDAISNDTLHTYVPKNDAEKATIDNYKEIANYVHPDKRVEGDSFSAHTKHTGEQAGWSLKSVWNGIKSTFMDGVARGFEQPDSTLLAAESMGLVEDGFNDRYSDEMQKSADAIREGIQSSYEALAKEKAVIPNKYPDLNDTGRKFGEFIGMTAQVAPMAVAGAISPYLGTAVLGAQVYGNDMGEALSEGASVDAASTYAFLDASKEMAYERLVGGIPFIGGVTDDLVKSVANKVTSKLFSNASNNLFTKVASVATKYGIKTAWNGAGEGFEELLATYTSPFIKRAVYDKDAPLATAEELSDAFMGGAVASVLLGTANDIGVGIVTKKQLPTNIAKFNELIGVLPEQIRPAKLSENATLDEYNAAVARVVADVEISQLSAEKTANSAMVKHIETEIEKLRSSDVITKENQDLIEEYSSYLETLNNSAEAIDAAIGELGAIKNGTANSKTISKYIESHQYTDVHLSENVQNAVDKLTNRTAEHYKYGADMSRIYRVNSRMMQSSDSVVDAVIVKEYIDTFVNMIASNKSRAYQLLSNEGINISQALYDYVVSGEIPSNSTNSAVFSKTASALKNMLVASFGDLASAHSSIYGVDTALNAQLASIQNGDFSFLAGKYLGETARALPEGNNSITSTGSAENIYVSEAEKKQTSEIITLKKERSIYSVFKDAKTIYEGVDCLTDKKVVIPKSDEAIEGISAVTDATIETTDKYNLTRVYDKSNSIVIEGEPKVGDNGTYVFKIDGKFYACRQKHLDAFNNGKRIIRANTNEKTGWTVHGENGKLVACFMPVKTDSITDEMYNSLPYVSEVLAEGKSTEETLTKMLKKQVDNDTIVNNEKNVNEVDAESQNESPHKEGIAYTNDNQEIKFRYKVIDISDVVASNDTEGKINPDYPAELQPRDRQRGASVSQVMDIASNLNPARMTESNSVSEGAPIVGFDNVVESGNGRTMALALAYDKYADKASEYKQYLIDHAEDFGIDVNSLPERPILVRERTTEVDRAEFARKANESNISSHNSTDQAKIDAERITDKAFSLLKYNDDGEINLFSKDNKPFIDEMVSNVFGKNDLNNLVTADGMLSANGVSRVENALFYKAYGDTTLTALLSERTDNPMKNIVKALLNASPRVAFISNGIDQGLFYDIDFSGDIVSAAKLLYDLKEEGTKLDAYMGQQSLIAKETDEVLKIAQYLDKNTRSAKRCTDFLKDILNEVQDMGSPDQISLFGNETQKSKGEIIDGVISRRNTENDTRGIGKTGQYDIGSSGETVEPDARLSQGDGRSEEGSAVEGNKSVESDSKTRTRGNSTRSDTEVSEGRKRGQKETVREDDSRTEKNSEQGIETPSNTKAKRSTSSKSSKNKLEDFGEKIGGAKKDLWRTRGLMGEDISEMSEYDKQKYIKKDNIWRKPDYDNIIESGVPAEVVYFVKKVRDNLPTAPSYSTTYTPERVAEIRESYINGVREVMEYAMSLKTVDDAKKMLEDFFVGRGYVEKGNYGYLSATEKYQQNNALYQKPNLVNFTAKAARNWEYNIVKPMKKDQFSVSKDEKIPKGYEIRELNNGEVAVVKGYRIVQGGFATNADAIKWAQENLNSVSTGKKKFTPPQLSSIHRQGPDYRENNTKDVVGQDYLETFKFRGGEFGNWMNENDRQSSMNYGYDALMDLAVALDILPEDISLGGKLAIAFGARGQAGAVAHFEPGSNVINLTKMKGAGSLAHEWGHGFDFFLANALGSKSTFLTDARGKVSDDSLQGIMSKLVNTMKYREMTADEEATRQAANKESNQKKAAAWVDYAFKGVTNKFTEEQQDKFNQLKEEYLQGWDQEGSFEIADKFSALHKEVTGRVIPKETRNSITSWYRIIGYRSGQSTVKGRIKTDFYTNSIEMDKRYSKADKGYWQSDVEMFARAFACYVKDKIPGRSDYLVGHAQCNSYMEEDGTLKAAFPVGSEREAINAVFDKLIAKAKEEGYLHHTKHKTDTYNTVRYSIESEADYGERRNLLSNGSGEWQNSKGSSKQTQGVDGRSRRYKEGRKTASERRKYCQTLKNSGIVERKIVYGHQCEVIPEAHYDDRMRKIADQNSQNGIDETIIITGLAKLPHIKDSSGKAKTAKGIFIKTKDGRKISVVQYDHPHFTPEQINDHEHVHEDFDSERAQKVKNIIFNTLPHKVKEEILGIISEDYSGVLTNAEEDAIEELVANILTEMHYLSDTFSELTKAYWNKDDAFISRWEYETNKQSFKDSVETGFVESMQELNERLDYEESVQLREYIMSVNHSSDILKEIDCKEIGNNIYVWKNISKTEYDIVRTDSLENGEMAKFIRKEVENGTYRKTEEIRKMLSELNDGYGSDDSSSYDVEDGRANSSNVGVSAEKRASDRYRNSERGSQDSSVETVRYSLADDGEYDFGDIWNEAVETYGAIPKGENPSREVSVPKKISEDEPVSYFARTMMEAGVTPDEALSEFEQAILDGTMSHEVITNKNALNYAQSEIKKLGFDDAMKKWEVLSDSGKIGKRELALGMELYNQCVNNKDYKNAMKIAAELAAEATRAGQTLQACRLLKLMSPDGQLYYLEKSVEKMNEEFKQKLGKKFEDIKLDEELMEEFFKAESEEKRNEAYDKICQNIADQMPVTRLDKWNSWRYLAMLGNPRTHIRNIIGNAVFTPAIRIKNYIGAIGEKISKVDMSERTKSLTKSKASVEFAKKDFIKMIKVLQGVNAKYAVTDDIESKRTIYKSKSFRWLEKLRTTNFKFLEMEDMWFLKTHYVDALARIITARKLDVDSMDSETLDNVRAYAVKEAQAATFRDANALAEGLNKLQRKAERSGNKAVRAASVLIEGVMPFKKTPLNIAKQGIQYSPVSILTGIYQAVKGVKDGTNTVSDSIDTLAKGLTGTGVMLLGFLLAQLGILVGEEEEPDKKKKYDKALGEQSYAIKIGDFSYTIDWAAPLNLSLFTGSALYEVTKDGEFTFKKIVDSLATLPEPLLELSVFSGISDTISSAQYEKTNPVTPIVTNMATNYFTQAFPTIGGQISRIIDSTKRNYYYEDKNSDVPGGLQNVIGKMASKIPFASKLFEPSVDVWGRVETYGGVVERTAENFVSPGYYSEEKHTAVDKELQRLFERTGETDVLPRTQQKYFTSDGVRYDMTAEQYTEAKVLRGRKSFELVNKLINSSKYQNMSDENKIKAIRKCYDDAGDYTKEQMIDKVKRNSKK